MPFLCLPNCPRGSTFMLTFLKETRLRFELFSLGTLCTVTKFLVSPLPYQCGTPMYIMHADQIFFPRPDRLTQFTSPISFSIKILFLPPQPLNKGKINFSLHFCSLYYQIHQKNSPKTLQKAKKKIQSQVLLFLPKKQMSEYLSHLTPPPHRKFQTFLNFRHF